MAKRIHVVPANLREAAGHHQETSEYLRTLPSSHPAIQASLDSLGPIFGELRAGSGERLAVGQRDSRRAGRGRMSCRRFSVLISGPIVAVLRVVGFGQRVVDVPRRALVVAAWQGPGQRKSARHGPPRHRCTARDPSATKRGNARHVRGRRRGRRRDLRRHVLG